MIKVITESGTEYIIDEDNQQIKRVPVHGTAFKSVLNGMINIGKFQPFTSIDTFGIGGKLHVIYPNEQRWSYSTTITEIIYEFEEPNFNKHHKQFTICDDPECLEEEQRIIEEYRKKD